MKKSDWYADWFNDDYLSLYAHRTVEEAEQLVDNLLTWIDLEPGASILDLACGAGRHSLFLQRHGFKVTGVDLSPTLLAQAIRSVPGVTFIRRDMRAITDLGPFDLVASFFTSFGYFATDEENSAVLEAAYDVLKPGGLFFLDYLNPSYVVDNLEPTSTVQLETGPVSIHRFVEGTCLTKTITFPTREYTECLRLYKKDQMVEMLTRCGFSIEELRGDYAGGPWHEKAPRQLFVCKKI